ncbi:MAG: hypothetical protein LBS47_00725 [Endomicrobium sp.]|jgi:hypothetical protein|nr:hypothetical protein [Endomicrobium sp.]
MNCVGVLKSSFTEDIKDNVSYSVVCVIKFDSSACPYFMSRIYGWMV